MNEMILEGGNLNKVIKIDETVRRPLKEWSPTIHRFLKFLEKNGFNESPKFYGIDKDNREILSFIRGDTGVDFPKLKPYMMSDEVLVDIAKILKKLHDISALFKTDIDDTWMLSYPGNLPLEVICHNDCAPYNVVFSGGRVSGIIDFDTACPAPRIWDIAYTLYTFVSLGRYVYDPACDKLEDYDSSKHAANHKRRIALFLNAYGIAQPNDLINQIIFRIETLCDTILSKANQGDEAFKKMLQEGHLLHYQNEIDFIRCHGHEWV